MQTSLTTKYKWIFFGTPEFSTIVLDEMKEAGLVPTLIITAEDKPKGRKLVLTPPEAKVWAMREGVPYLQLKSLRDPSVADMIKSYSDDGFDFSLVASYGKIIPQAILDMPRRQTLNIHPSLLPKLRGASPIQSAILSENETGVTIIRLDADMDHGPILARKKIPVPEWPPYADELEAVLAREGGKMIVEILPDWMSGKLAETEQDHASATFCKKIEKTDGLLDLSAPAETNLRKIRAYSPRQSAYFFHAHSGTQMRVIVKKAHIDNGALILDRVLPEGRKEMDYADFLKGFSN